MLQAKIKVRLLKQLPLAMHVEGKEQRRLFKLLETLCFIKALWIDEPYRDTPAAQQELATASGRSTKTIGRRIDDLVEQKWLHPRLKAHGLRRATSYDSISWDALREKYSIKHTHFYHIETVPGVHLEHIIDSKQDQEKLNQCEHAYHNRIEQNPELKEIIETVAGNAHNAQHVATHQLRNFKFQEILYDADQRYALNLHYTHKEEKKLNADFALNYNRWRKLKGYGSRGGYAYHKRMQQQRGLITITKRIEDLPPTPPGPTTREERYHTRLGFVRFNKFLQLPQLIQPDLICVLPLKGLQQRAEQGSLIALHSPAKAVDPVRHAWVIKSWITKRKKQDEAKTAA